MDALRFRWRCVAVIGLASFLALYATWHVSHSWMIWYQPGSRLIALHYGAIGVFDDPGSKLNLSRWSVDAWHARRDVTPCTIWWPEVQVVGTRSVVYSWYPIWPLVAAAGVVTLVGVARPRLLHWTRCRGCGYRRIGITYDQPCPECGEVPRTLR